MSDIVFSAPDNYATWSADMKILLMGRGCWGFVEGTENYLRIVQNIKKIITIIYGVTGHLIIYIKINLQSLDHYLQKLFMLKKHGKCLRISIVLKRELQQFNSWINFSLLGMKVEKGMICLQPN